VLSTHRVLGNQPSRRLMEYSHVDNRILRFALRAATTLAL